MHFIFSVIFLISIGQYYCLPKACTKEERCLPVDASVCDNSKCLLLNKSDVDLTLNENLNPYIWNIARSSLCSYCTMSAKYETPCPYGESPTMIASFTIMSGERCNETMTITQDYVVDPDPSTGQVRLLTTQYSDDKYEECYLYMETGQAFVYRKCLVQPNYPSGQACALIVALAPEKCSNDEIEDFLYKLDADMPKINVDCI